MLFDGQCTGAGANIRRSPPAEFTDGAQGLGGAGHQAGGRIYRRRRNELARFGLNPYLSLRSSAGG